MTMPTSNTRWDLMVDSPGDPSWNMAKDAWLLERTSHTGRTVLRLYQWQGPVLSLGRTQRPERDLDPAACLAEKVPLVRRLTGGRAVLHGADLTYSICAPAGRPPFQGGILQVYRQISRGLVSFLENLGQPVEVKAYTARQRSEMISPICFSTPSAYEILVSGKKLIGSAQRVVPGAFLQHGSIPLTPQHQLLSRLFLDTAPEEVAVRMTDLETLGILPGVSIQALVENFIAAFKESFGVRFTPAPWSEADEAMVRQRTQQFSPLRFEPTPDNPTAGDTTAGDTTVGAPAARPPSRP